MCKCDDAAMEALKTRAATQFGVIRSLCYPEAVPTCSKRTPDEFTQGTRKMAETDGHRLTKIKPSHFQKADMETVAGSLVHEATHYNDGSKYGKGTSSHGPQFWEEFARNINTLCNSQTNRSVIESLFNDIGTEFDWNRFKYRAVQDVSQVDKRSETIDERKAKFASDINYEGYEDFENADWGFAWGRDTTHLGSEPAQVNFFIEDQRFADDYTDDELLEFVEEQDGVAPSPLVFINPERYKTNSPQIIRDSDDWALPKFALVESKKAMALQERRGHGYTGLAFELLPFSGDLTEFEQSSPVPIDDLPDAQSITREYRLAF